MFKKKNEPFICLVCGATVPIHPTSSRDHCASCLYGLHVDITPGDRANLCKGILEPIGLEMKNGKERIVYRCQSCGQILLNIVAPDDDKEVLHDLASYNW